MVPKLFHLTYKHNKLDQLPESFQQNLERIRRYYPDHEVRVHDDAAIHEFAAEHFASYYESTFKNMPKIIMQVDTVRYMWMHVYGGIYCDFDIHFLKRLDFTQGAIFFEREWTYPINNAITDSVHNCCFASEPGHPIWLEILEGIAVNVAGLKQSLFDKLLRKPIKAVFDVTGPNAISKIITDHQLLSRYKEVTVLPGPLLYQRGYSKGTVDTAYVVHETFGSWKK